VRLLSATHKDLVHLIKIGTFRQDLFYRLNVIELRMPSLQERPEDTLELADHILVRLGREHNQPPPQLAPETIEALKNYSFPGNVRELENTLERAFTLCEGQTIVPEDLHLPQVTVAPPPLSESAAVQPSSEQITSSSPTLPPVDTNLESYLEELEKEAITKALEATRYNKTAAAEKLGITFRALRYRLKKLGID
jgi:two-component system response regulator PilR (NtrC family)